MAKKHAAHHGGAWKVAYADFVTAMMALFLVLWLTSQDEKIKEAVERSFRNPFMSLTKDSVGVIPNKDTQAVKSSSGNFDSASAVELTMLRRISQDLAKSLESGSAQAEDENSFKLDLSPEGVRITVFDRARKAIFEEGSARLTAYGKWIFSTLAWQLSRYPTTFLVELEGHTERGFKPLGDDYGSWEMSSDRANAARRFLVQNGMGEEQIRKVSGFADTMPMPGYPPSDQINRRVTTLLKIRPGDRLP
jgi:chemotaxis protein MotB